MKRKTQPFRRQVMLFPRVAQGDRVPTVPTEAKRELVQALADLLLEGMKPVTSVEGGRDDEHEGNA